MARQIVAAVYEADGITLVGTLASDNKREWLDDLSAEGSHGGEIKIGHADEALLQPDRIVRYSINGTARWQGVIEELDPTYADPTNRQSGRVIRWSGRGTLAVLEDAVVYPELGLGRVSPDTRFFNFASLDYDDSAWGTAVELKQQDDPDDTKPWYRAPRNWPDPNAKWVGPTDGDIPGEVPPGDIYLRGTFTVGVGEGGEYRFHITADDGFELYVDGNREAAEQLAGLWGTTRYVDVLLDEGTHLIAAKGINFDRPVAATNVFGVIISVSQLLGGGAYLGDVVSGTSAGTSMLAYPTTTPGMTAGKILDVILSENQARGTLPDLAWDFTDTLDSDGNAWPKELDVAFPVNTSVLDVVRHLVDEHAVTVKMSATGLTLHAYVAKGADLSATVAAEYGVNISRLAFKKVRARKNVALSRTAEGRWLETSDVTSVAAYGRREVGLSMGSAPSDDAADRQTAAFFADNAYPVEAITDLQLEPVNSVPYTDFGVGDLISCTAASGGTSAYRVQALRVSEDAAGQPIYTPELVLETLWSAFNLWGDTTLTWAGLAA
jgi:hypothetical protein